MRWPLSLNWDREPVVMWLQAALQDSVLDDFKLLLGPSDVQLSADNTERLSSACLVVNALGPKVGNRGAHSPRAGPQLAAGAGLHAHDAERSIHLFIEGLAQQVVRVVSTLHVRRIWLLGLCVWAAGWQLAGHTPSNTAGLLGAAPCLLAGS